MSLNYNSLLFQALGVEPCIKTRSFSRCSGCDRPRLVSSAGMLHAPTAEMLGGHSNCITSCGQPFLILFSWFKETCLLPLVCTDKVVCRELGPHWGTGFTDLSFSKRKLNWNFDIKATLWVHSRHFCGVQKNHQARPTVDADWKHVFIPDESRLCLGAKGNLSGF